MSRPKASPQPSADAPPAPLRIHAVGPDGKLYPCEWAEHVTVSERFGEKRRHVSYALVSIAATVGRGVPLQISGGELRDRQELLYRLLGCGYTLLAPRPIFDVLTYPPADPCSVDADGHPLYRVVGPGGPTDHERLRLKRAVIAARRLCRAHLLELHVKGLAPIVVPPPPSAQPVPRIGDRVRFQRGKRTLTGLVVAIPGGLDPARARVRIDGGGETHHDLAKLTLLPPQPDTQPPLGHPSPITSTTDLLSLLHSPTHAPAVTRSAMQALANDRLVTVGDLLDRAAQGDRHIRDGAPYRDDAQLVYAALRAVSGLPPVAVFAIGDKVVEALAAGTITFSGRAQAPPPGEPIGPLGLSAKDLDAAMILCKWDKVAKVPVRVRPITLDGRLFVVRDALHSFAGHSWTCLPLYPAMPFPSGGPTFAERFPGARTYLNPPVAVTDEQRREAYTGTRVTVGKREYVIGPAAESRVLIQPKETADA